MDWLNENNDLFYLASKESALSDPQYRYKIANPIIITTGKKGNRTTWFENSEYYSEKLGVSSIFFGKFIGNKISCPSNFDKEKNCISWKGEYNNDLIQSHLKEFIKIYILCPKCDYPETNLYLDEKKYIGTLCRSCGESRLILSKYMDKTYDFIQKNIK
jgi:translation initiation factor 5